MRTAIADRRELVSRVDVIRAVESDEVFCDAVGAGDELAGRHAGEP